MNVHLERVTDIPQSLLNALEEISWKEIVPRGAKVAIKVNLCDYVYKEGVVTSPELLHHLIKVLKTRSAEVVVVESDGLLYSADHAFKFNRNEKMDRCCWCKIRQPNS